MIDDWRFCGPADLGRDPFAQRMLSIYHIYISGTILGIKEPALNQTICPVHFELLIQSGNPVKVGGKEGGF